MRKLPRSFYQRANVVTISKELLGMVLCAKTDGVITKAIITETEAYAGKTDKASHAFDGRRTQRTEPMYGPGGHAYIYLCYGIHYLFNVVTNVAGTPHAVLIRAATPLFGVTTMQKRRKKSTSGRMLMPGPGTVSQALGLDTSMTGTDLTGGAIWIEDHEFPAAACDIIIGPRIGIDYAGEDAARPCRFILNNLLSESE